jgi:hypothetical protein
VFLGEPRSARSLSSSGHSEPTAMPIHGSGSSAPRSFPSRHIRQGPTNSRR